MRYARSALLAVHGVAHLVGCAQPWRLITAPGMPYQTTLRAGRVDVGEAGIRVVGVFWLLLAGVMMLTAIGVAVQARWASAVVLPVAVVSLVLCEHTRERPGASSHGPTGTFTFASTTSLPPPGHGSNDHGAPGDGSM